MIIRTRFAPENAAKLIRMAGGVVDCQIFRINGLAPLKSMKRYFVTTSNISTVLIQLYYFYLLMLTGVYSIRFV